MIRFPSRRTWLEWRLLARASARMAAVALALRICPYPIWRGAGLSLERPASRKPLRGAASTDQIVRAVNGASCVVPGGGNCLVRALTARALLARYGHASTLMLGVAREAAGRLRGHAWLQCGGRTVIGQSGANDYAPIE